MQVSTGLSPTGIVERVDGGFRLRGRWSFSSGCDFCSWAVVGGVVPPTDASGPADVRTFLVPRRDYKIEDHWHVMGLCGTGSKDVVVADAFVPEYRTHSYRDAFHLTNPGTAINDGPLYRLPLGVVFPNALASPALGVALGALAAFREQSGTRVNVRDGTRAAEDPFIHLRLAESSAEVDAARERMLGNFSGMMGRVSSGGEIPLLERARYRWDAAKAVEWSVRAVDRLFEASGGRGHLPRQPAPARVAATSTRCARTWRTTRRRSPACSVGRSSASRRSTSGSEGVRGWPIESSAPNRPGPGRRGRPRCRSTAGRSERHRSAGAR